MRIFLAGATGAIGTRLTPRLVQSGHSVVALTRSEQKARLIQSWGAQPVIADGLDERAVIRAVVEARPEVVVHQMTALAGVVDLRRFDRAFAQTSRLRTRGLDVLMAAARQAGARRFVAQSYCGWPFAREGGPVKAEDAPLDPHPPRQFQRALKAIRYLEDTVAGAPDLDGVVLRYGAFYGPRTGMLDESAKQEIRARRFPLIGEAQGWWSFIHLDDAAEATRIAIESDVQGVYNIVDDEPAQVNVWLPALAQMLGAKPPRRVPIWLGRLLAGEHLVLMMTQVRAGSNAKAKRDLGWRPRLPSWRQGFAQALSQETHESLAAGALRT